MGMLSDRCSGQLGGGTDECLSSAPSGNASHPFSGGEKPTLAAADEMNRAIRKMFDGWKSGAFDLPKLAEQDLCAAHECAVRYAGMRTNDEPSHHTK